MFCRIGWTRIPMRFDSLDAIILDVERRVFLVLLALILGFGAYLRLVDLAGPSLWLDEILHLQVTQSLADEPWYQHLAGVREVKGGTENGALYYRLQIWGQKLAPGDAGVRLFPAIIGTLTLPLMALAGYRLGGYLLALVATFLLAVSPLHVYFSREGRPYYLLMALALVLLYALLLKGSRSGTGLAAVGCALTTYVGIVAIPILLSFLLLAGMALLWSLRQGATLRRSPYLFYVLAGVLALGLAYGLYMTQSKVNSPGLDKAPVQAEVQKSPQYQSPLSKRSLETFVASMTTSGHPTILTVNRSWILLALSLLGLVGAVFRRSGDGLLAAGMFLLPAVVSIAALVSVGRWYGVRYTSSALPAFLLLVALGIVVVAELVGEGLQRFWGQERQAMQTGVTWTVATVILLVCVAPNLDAARVDPYRKLDWRGVAQFFDAVALDDEPVVIPNGWPQICLSHYLQEFGREPEFVSAWETAAIAESIVAEHPRGWLLTAGFRRNNEVRAWMHNFLSVLKKPEEEMDLFFFPDFVTLLETRFAAGKGAVFEELFASMGQRFEFDGGGLTLQGRGWSYPEQNDQGASFRWVVGEQAELGLPIGEPRDARIRLRALPFLYPEAPPQRMALWLNETHLATLDLSAAWNEYEVEVPASSWSSGANVLTLRFANTVSPATVIEGAGDGRSLSVALDYLEVFLGEVR